MQITAKSTKTGKSYTGEFNVGGNLSETSKLFGEAVVFDKARSAIIVGVQSVIRTALDAGKSKSDIDKLVVEHKPGLKKQGKPKAEKLRDAFRDLPPEERSALLKELAAS